MPRARTRGDPSFQGSLELGFVGLSILTDVYLYTAAVSLMATSQVPPKMTDFTRNDATSDERQFYAAALGLSYGATMLVTTLGALVYPRNMPSVTCFGHVLRAGGVLLFTVTEGFFPMVMGNVLNGLAAGITLVQGLRTVVEWRDGYFGARMAAWILGLTLAVYLPALNMLLASKEASASSVAPRSSVWLWGLLGITSNTLLDIICFTIRRAEHVREASAQASASQTAAEPPIEMRSVPRAQAGAVRRSEKRKRKVEPTLEKSIITSLLTTDEVRIVADLIGLVLVSGIITATIPLLYKFMGAHLKTPRKALKTYDAAILLAPIVFAAGALLLVLPAWNQTEILITLGMSLSCGSLVVFIKSPWESMAGGRVRVTRGDWVGIAASPAPAWLWALHISLAAGLNLLLAGLVEDYFKSLVAKKAADKARRDKDKGARGEDLRAELLAVPAAIEVGVMLGTLIPLSSWKSAPHLPLSGIKDTVDGIVLPLLVGSGLMVVPFLVYSYDRWVSVAIKGLENNSVQILKREPSVAGQERAVA